MASHLLASSLFCTRAPRGPLSLCFYFTLFTFASFFDDKFFESRLIEITCSSMVSMSLVQVH